ncbi:MAG: cbb3-type cytochrome c oxidase subunit I [Myxococcota bacterium]|nr:cbb3-type cytochrome c oxidase subunit I [Myxococcota bacterium]
MLLVLFVGVTGVMVMGIKTYQDAPPIPDFTSRSGEVVVSHELILQGQSVFQRYALMDYGSFFGDGANRGTDFTADALHQRALAMKEYYLQRQPVPTDPEQAAHHEAALQVRVQAEIKANTFDLATNRATLTPADAYAFERLVEHYTRAFRGEGPEAFSPANYLSDPEQIRALTAFFYWGAWVCGAQRPGQTYSYTHNWPYDPVAGNLPSPGVTFWSVAGLFGLILTLGGVLYLYGKFDKIAGLAPEKPAALLGRDQVERFAPTATQRAAFKFLAVAVCVFLFQVLAGVLTVHDFVGFTEFFGVDLAVALPITVVRGWHVLLSVLWISTCWIAGSLFLLPMITKTQPSGQRALINTLFFMLVTVVVGSTAGIFLGPHGLLGEYWRELGNQGWEFLELGRVWQVLLFASLILWAVIVARGVWPMLKGQPMWSLPYWLLYTVTAVVGLFISSFVAREDTNFVIADFWRWMVVHMWAESFFEVFTTVVVAYFMHLMGLITLRSGARVVFIGTILYLGSGLLGISHNFYWNAKPVITLALGSIFSTLQVVPLVLLSLEAWKTRRMPAEALRQSDDRGKVFGQTAAFHFLLAVNFWNFMGAGVFGLIINLPIMNYYEHGTYLTVNHGHAALMGVYGNLSLAAVAFCSRYLVQPERWNEQLMKTAMWSINVGLALMVVLDLFPAGILQLSAVLENGLWYGRSQAFIQSTAFQSLTWMRSIGGAVFLLGGVVPLTWFMISRWRSLKPAVEAEAGAETGSGLGQVTALPAPYPVPALAMELERGEG